MAGIFSSNVFHARESPKMKWLVTVPGFVTLPGGINKDLIHLVKGG